MIRKRIRASGRVQGVFYRDSTQREAVRRGVAGWVRNCDDGTVEAVFEGDVSAVAAMIEFCRAGPGHSSVDTVEVVDEPMESLVNFRVL